MSVYPVAAPYGVRNDEVERLLRRVAAEHGAVVVERSVPDDLPLGVRWLVRPGEALADALVVTAAPGRVVVETQEPDGPWSSPRAGRFAARLGELLGE
jgi:hypothetical protein